MFKAYPLSDGKRDGRRADNGSRGKDTEDADYAPCGYVVRMSHSTLRSNLFTWIRCSVLVSYDGSSLLVSPNPSGDTEVIGDTIRVPGLSSFFPFSERRELEFTIQGSDILIALS